MRQITDDTQLRRLIGHRINLVCFWQFGYNLHTSLNEFPLQIEGRSHIRSEDDAISEVTTGGSSDTPFWIDTGKLVDLIEQKITDARLLPDAWGCEIEFENGLTLAVHTDSPYEDLHLGTEYY